MDLVKETKDGRSLIRPVEEEDMALFSHCSGGSIAVTVQEFEDTVQPLLFMHDVGMTTVTDQTL